MHPNDESPNHALQRTATGRHEPCLRTSRAVPPRFAELGVVRRCFPLTVERTLPFMTFALVWTVLLSSTSLSVIYFSETPPLTWEYSIKSAAMPLDRPYRFTVGSPHEVESDSSSDYRHFYFLFAVRSRLRSDSFTLTPFEIVPIHQPDPYPGSVPLRPGTNIQVGDQF